MGIWRSFSRAERILIVLFVLTLPFVQPRVRGDGIGYYAWARSLLIDHNLQFRGDWKDPRTLPLLVQTDRNGRIVTSNSHTPNGHIANFYPVGPAMLWAPFLIVAHGVVLAVDRLGLHVAANGFSRPYLIAMAGATALYGFLGLWLSFQLAQSYFEERWALMATLGIWFASSLPVYMYVDTAWSHAHSAFAVALFLWYWDRTRKGRAARQWILLGLISGLMLDVYYANAVFLLVPLLESFFLYRTTLGKVLNHGRSVWTVLRGHILFCMAVAIGFSPTLLARKIVFGSFLAIGGYANANWHWTSPAFWSVLVSSKHGLLAWTPILIPAVAGLILLCLRVPEIGGFFLAAAAAFYLLIAVYPWWGGVSSFGNRFFVSLTPLFVLSLAAAFSEFARLWGDARGAALRIGAVVSLLILWNLGLVFQWTTGLMPAVGEVYWQEVLYNQFRIVPEGMLHALQDRFTRWPEITGMHSDSGS